jgi:hypothetical protein
MLAAFAVVVLESIIEPFTSNALLANIKLALLLRNPVEFANITEFARYPDDEPPPPLTAAVVTLDILPLATTVITGTNVELP